MSKLRVYGVTAVHPNSLNLTVQDILTFKEFSLHTLINVFTAVNSLDNVELCPF